MPKRTCAVLIGVLVAGCYNTMTERREIRSCQDLAWLAKQLSSYRSVHGTFPRVASVQELRPLLQGVVIANDQWGKPFRYLVSPDARHYSLSSAGADGRFENPPGLGSPLHGLALEDASRDIVVQDGLFVQFPTVASRVARPAAPN